MLAYESYTEEFGGSPPSLKLQAGAFADLLEISNEKDDACETILMEVGQPCKRAVLMTTENQKPPPLVFEIKTQLFDFYFYYFLK